MYSAQEYYQKNKERIREVGKKWRQKNKEKIATKQKEWRLKNKEHYRSVMRVASKKWREGNKDKVRSNRYSTRDKLRTDVLNAYGHQCTCCGEGTREFLAIDHINNDGAEHKRSLGLKSAQAFYTWLRTNNYPKENFQILCHNCNMAKGFYKRCPHKDLP